MSKTTLIPRNSHNDFHFVIIYLYRDHLTKVCSRHWWQIETFLLINLFSSHLIPTRLRAIKKILAPCWNLVSNPASLWRPIALEYYFLRSETPPTSCASQWEKELHIAIFSIKKWFISMKYFYQFFYKRDIFSDTHIYL